MPGGGGEGADGTATGGLFGDWKDMVRSDAEEADRSSGDKGCIGEAANADADATDAVV